MLIFEKKRVKNLDDCHVLSAIFTGYKTELLSSVKRTSGYCVARILNLLQENLAETKGKFRVILILLTLQ